MARKNTRLRVEAMSDLRTPDLSNLAILLPFSTTRPSSNPLMIHRMGHDRLIDCASLPRTPHLLIRPSHGSDRLSECHPKLPNSATHAGWMVRHAG